MKFKLKYKDETDRSYGLAGMAISMVVLDGEEYVNSISIDAPVGESVDLAQQFFFVGNPRLSAKIAWNEMLKHLQLAAGMVISNAMCRSYVQHRHKLSSDMVDELRNFIKNEAHVGYELDDDECDVIFDKSLAYFDRLYSYAHVHEIASRFAATLTRQRQLSSQEIFEQLGQLR